MKIESGKYYIIRCGRAGVFFAHVAEWDPATGTAALTDCRRLWYWDGAASLSQLATEGVKKPQNCKFTVVVPEMVVGGVIEMIPCSDAAVKGVTEVPEWRN